MQEELSLLREVYPDVRHELKGDEDWFLVSRYRVPSGWRLGGDEIAESPVVFSTKAGYPTAEPYAFLMPATINFNGVQPANATASGPTPFEGSWLQFSWSPETWFPTANARQGSNLLAWVRSFSARLLEGA